MLREQKFHKMVQQQATDEKEKLWNKTSNELENEDEDLGGVLAKKHYLSRQNKIIVCVVAAIVLIVSIALICRFLLPNNKEDEIRYCGSGDYHYTETIESLKDYSEANNLDLLYFEWYENSLYCMDYQYFLNDTEETICWSEELIDINEYDIIQYVTLKNTQIDFLEVILKSCQEQTIIKNTEVKYSVAINETLAYFYHGDYCYYFKLASNDNNYLFNLLSDLLK